MDWLLPAVRPVPPLYAVRVAPNAKKGTGRGNSRAVESGAPDERHVADGKTCGPGTVAGVKSAKDVSTLPGADMSSIRRRRWQDEFVTGESSP